MKDWEKHYQQYEHNYELYLVLDEDRKLKRKFIDWQITLLFYSILHLIDGYLLREYGVFTKNHKDRRDKISRFISKVRTDYSTLYKYCEESRYKFLIFSDDNYKVQVLLHIESLTKRIKDLLL